ncbi:MAG: GAF domain-containing sensor histidine kinase [bacterium]|nr:GAF domain-containing sensor histidine kinase [bacterium]
MNIDRRKRPRRRFTLDLAAGRDGLPRLWGHQGFWQIRLRWAVAPLMIVAVAAGRALGFEFQVVPILIIALASPAYNALFAWVYSRHRNRIEADPRLNRIFTTTGVFVDYAAMFLLIYYTGGVSSPLSVFLIFHVIIAAIQFPTGTAYALAGVAAGGLWIFLIGQIGGWLQCHHVAYRAAPLHYLDQPPYAIVVLSAFTATLFFTAGIVGRLADRLRARVGDLADATSSVARANVRLRSLYRMLSAIGAERRMQPLLETVTEELSKVTKVQAVAVKLLSEDGKELRYVAAHGLPASVTADKVVYVDQSPINQRVVEEKILLESRLESGDQMQLQEELRELGIRSAVLAPLKVEDRVIGTLGFYDRSCDRFSARDHDFLQLAAELVAIAIDHARAYEAIETLMRERTEFMLEVAHNLRAPLAAGLSIIDLLTEGYLGELAEPQRDHLDRLESRLRALNQTIGELLAIARTRDRSREIEDVVVDLGALARYTEQTFKNEAAAQAPAFRVPADADLPPIASGLGLLESLMDNLVSNAIKYTPEGGRVEVRFEHPDTASVRIEVEDTGIGIPSDEKGKLFREFFRASNARRTTALGTGLGLVLVKQTVERHAGELDLSSEEGQGTKVTITLPLDREAALNARPERTPS